MQINLYKTHGALDTNDARLYVVRDADRQVINKLQHHQYVLITEPHRQGTTSLLHAIRRNPIFFNSRFVYLDLGSKELENSSEEAWYRSLTAEIRRQLDDLPLDTLQVSPPRSGGEWGEYLARLAKAAGATNRHVIIECDNVGLRFIPNQESFFAQMRILYSQRYNLYDYNFISFVLAGNFNPGELMPDRRISPFNIADRVPLRDFEPEQVRQLVGMGNWNADQADILAQQIFDWTNGQPYLTQWFCNYLRTSENQPTVDQLAQQALLNEEYFKIIRAELSKYADLLGYAERVYQSEKGQGEKIKYIPDQIGKQFQLELLGVLKENIEKDCALCCRLIANLLEQLLGYENNAVYPLPSDAIPPEKTSIPESLTPLQKPPANWIERIQIVFTPQSQVFPTTSSQYVHVDQFSFVTLHLNGEGLQQPETILRISARIENRSHETILSACLRNGEKISIPITLVLDPNEAKKITSIQPANLTVRIEQVNFVNQSLNWIYEISEPIQLQARDVALLGVEKSDGSILDLTDNLAAWVTFAEPEINKQLRKASDHHPENRLVGYQGGGNEEQRAQIVRDQVQAIYSMLKEDIGLQYINSTFSLGRSQGEISQRVHLPIQSLETASANCIDGTVLFASLLLAASIEPVILLMEGHAFVGWKIWRGIDRYEFVETTMISRHDFATARVTAQKKYNDLLQSGAFQKPPFDPGFAKIVDIVDCQQTQHIYPFASGE